MDNHRDTARVPLTRIAFGLTLLVCAIRNWIVTFRELVRFYTNVPIWDAFEWISHYSRYRNFDWSVLWIQHNEHRNIGTEILVAIDVLLFQGRQILPTVAGLLAYAGALAVFAAIAWRDWNDRWLAVCATLMMLALAGYKLCVVSLTIPFLTSWPQLEFFGIAALASAVSCSRRRSRTMLAASILFALMATYSLANGMLIWPLLLAAAMLLRFQRIELGVIALSGALAIAAFFFHYRNLHSLALGTALTHPLYLAGFIGNFLGMPFSAALGFSKPWLAGLYGWLALLFIAADAVWIVRKRLWSNPLVIVAGGYILLALGSTLATTLGRMDPGDKFFQAARAGRYITEPTLLWCALMLLTAWLLRSTWRARGTALFLVAFGLMSSLALLGTNTYYSGWEEYFQRGQWAAIAAAAGTVDGEVADVLFPGGEYVSRWLPALKTYRLALFADDQPFWIGQPMTRFFDPKSPGFIPGTITAVLKRGANYEVQGWADGAASFIFVDDAGRIVGFALKPTAGVAKLYTHDVPRKLAFTGFIRGEFGSRTFSTWAVDQKRRRLAHLGRVVILRDSYEPRSAVEVCPLAGVCVVSGDRCGHCSVASPVGPLALAAVSLPGTAAAPPH